MDLTKIKDLLFIGEKEIIVCGIKLYEYTIREIYKIGKDDFKKKVYFSVLEPIDFFKRSDVKKEDFKGVATFDLFGTLGKEHIEWCESMLNLATRRKWKYNKVTNNFDNIEFVDDKPKITRINKQQYSEIAKVISIMYSINRYDPYEKYGENFDLADDFVKKAIEEQVEIEAQENKNNSVTISSIVEGVACHNDSGFNANTIGDITIYQLAKIYERIQQKNTFDNHMRALYSGCMTKEYKLDINTISWVKNLDI